MGTVVDLSPEHEATYFQCLEEWNAEIQEAGDHKACWYRKYRERGLRVKLALDDDGAVAGMIQYLPVEHSTVEGRGLYFIPCIWVHGHKQGLGDRRGHGLGVALLAAAEEDARALGAAGMAAWGLWLPFWMRASWYRRHGYRKADRDGIALLLWKPFLDGVEPPRWIRPRRKPGAVPGRVTVTAFLNGWCPAQATTVERARRAAATFGDVVRFELVDTSERPVFLEWGISDAVFVDGRQVSFGPPPAYEKLRRTIERRVRRLGRPAAVSG